MKYPHNINYCSNKQQEEMQRRGWMLKLANNFHEEIDGDALYTRLIDEGHSKVKIYYGTSMVRGLHKNFAFVK